jgi:hypothetical protein
MLPRETTEQPFMVEPASSCLVTEDGIRLWRVLFRGSFVGYTRRPGQEVAELNEKWRISQQKRRAGK